MSKHYQILVIDDDKSYASLTKKVLEEIGGLTVEALVDNSKAMDKIRKDKPTLVIVDLMMPPPDGLTICQNIRKDDSLKDIRIMILSAKGFEADKKIAFKLGADAFVEKAEAGKKLVSSVKSLL